MSHKAILFLFALLAPLSLTGGFRCYYADDSDADLDRIFFGNHSELRVVVSPSKPLQIPIEGLAVVFSDRVRQTDSSGRVTLSGHAQPDFYIGDIFLGTTTVSDGRVGLEQIAGRDANTSVIPVNILRLMLSLDRFRNDNRITIPPQVSRLASVANPQAAVYIENLDFNDTLAFENAAVNLLPLLTQDYPFTVELIGIEAAEAKL